MEILYRTAYPSFKSTFPCVLIYDSKLATTIWKLCEKSRSVNTLGKEISEQQVSACISIEDLLVDNPIFQRILLRGLRIRNGCAQSVHTYKLTSKQFSKTKTGQISIDCPPNLVREFWMTTSVGYNVLDNIKGPLDNIAVVFVTPELQEKINKAKEQTNENS